LPQLNVVDIGVVVVFFPFFLQPFGSLIYSSMLQYFSSSKELPHSSDLIYMTWIIRKCDWCLVGHSLPWFLLKYKLSSPQ
jgi:hypothetical protein